MNGNMSSILLLKADLCPVLSNTNFFNEDMEFSMSQSALTLETFYAVKNYKGNTLPEALPRPLSYTM
jgi:hypothetical protein